ncbi:Clavaminate synthase-like protein [Aspergillus cavernicola]|uniref:Clavaminate synthase-like protein n=1 Tax=Aspergillus cavernicola TaxID=176166 RepID=A0ABR4HF40_9EURO
MSSSIKQLELGGDSVEGDIQNIPIIDLFALNSRNSQDRQNLAEQVYKACTQVGFFYIKNHGISKELIAALHEEARLFFALPEEQKMEYYVGKSKKYRGYMPLYTEQPTGIDEPDPATQPTTGAFSESFDIGYELSADPERTVDDVLPPDIYSLYGENQWPSDSILFDFQKTYLTYFREALSLSRKLMRVFALALDMEEDFFDPMMKYPGVASRMLHYPPQPVEGEADYECFTILSQDNVPALQVRNKQGEWILAPPIPGTMVVNIADCLSIWTNRKFKSTIHRVANMTGQERYSIPFFFGVDYNTTVSVLENCISDERPACKEPFKAGEFVRAQLAKAYVGYSGEA